MSKQVGCTPTSSIGGISYTYSSICIRMLHGNPYSSHHIYHMAFSPMIVLIDVSLSHLFVFLLHFLSVSPFRCQLSCSSSSLHECSIYRKGVDQFDLYLTSGLGTSPDKNPNETKCETLVDSCSQQPFFSFFPVPCLHANTIWRHSIHGQQELLHLLFFCCLCQC